MEEEFEELKALFRHKKASAKLPTLLVQKKANRQLHLLRKNHILNITTFILTAIALVIIDRVNAQKMETSTYGFSILIGCSLYYALSKAYLLYRLDQLKPDEPVLKAIQKLEDYKKLNIWLHTYGEVIYALVLCTGIYLYLRPVLDRFLLDKTGRTILCFWWIWGACFCWMLIYTFVIKRRRMKKDLLVLETYKQSLTFDADNG